MATAPARPGVTGRETQDIEALARAYFDAFNARDFDRGATLIADDAEIVLVPWDMTVRGPAGYRQIEGNWVRGFPDGKVEVVNLICQGDICACEFIGRGTNAGPMVGPDGREIPASNNQVMIRFCEIMQFRSGKLVRSRQYFDSASMLRQLGVAS